MILHKAVVGRGTGEITAKKSRFIADVASVESAEEAQLFLEEIKKKYWDARHHCYAFSVGVDRPLTRFSDDGEPGGTAGKPILEVITGEDLRNVIIVVTRYFGGTLLGTGGLVRAYTDASKEGIVHSQVVWKIPCKKMSIQLDYTDYGKVQYLIAEEDATVLDTLYSDKVEIIAAFALEDAERLCKSITDQTGGRAALKELGEE